jgi:hypothetical protein
MLFGGIAILLEAALEPKREDAVDDVASSPPRVVVGRLEYACPLPFAEFVVQPAMRFLGIATPLEAALQQKREDAADDDVASLLARAAAGQWEHAWPSPFAEFVV